MKSSKCRLQVIHTYNTLYGARESELPQPKLLPTADLLVLLVYIGGKRGTSLAQMLDWRSLFPQAPPINGLC